MMLRVLCAAFGGHDWDYFTEPDGTHLRICSFCEHWEYLR